MMCVTSIAGADDSPTTKPPQRPVIDKCFTAQLKTKLHRCHPPPLKPLILWKSSFGGTSFTGVSLARNLLFIVCNTCWNMRIVMLLCQLASEALHHSVELLSRHHYAV